VVKTTDTSWKMTQIVHGAAGSLSPKFAREIAEYRHKIFIQRLGWNLPTQDGLELDQFDRPDTIYVVARDTRGAICGCARLLPTMKPYLLGDVFANLMGGLPPPRHEKIWELSRFAAASVCPETAASFDRAQNTRQLLAGAIAAAANHGATRLITVSPLGIERLLYRMGVHAHRAGPPVNLEGKPIYACWIEIDDRTMNALEIDAGTSTSHPGKSALEYSPSVSAFEAKDRFRTKGTFRIHA
jgi:acyl homoserine lactone synthase